MGTANVLKDSEWITVIAALLHDSVAESRRLAQKLLEKTKHGRQVRMLRLICTQKPTLSEMQKTVKMSRRTIFRYLNGLEDYGIRLEIGDDYRYAIAHLPDSFRRLVGAVGKARR